MKIPPFDLERYFAHHEFTAPFLLSASDCESLTMAELLTLADAETETLWRDLRLGYTDTAGHPLLREAIAALYQGIEATDLITVVPGEGIFLLMHALLSPGDHVVCTTPAYQSLHEVARANGCDVSYWEPEEERGWCFDVAQLARQLRDDTRLVVINFPHNPTGAVLPREDFAAVIELARQHGLYLLSDEMYRFLERSNDATLPAACESYPRAISLGGLSKAFGLPGLRTGWLATRDREVLERLGQLKDYTTLCASAASEILAIIALRNRREIIARHHDRLQRHLGVLEDFFAQFASLFTWQPPAGGSICFPRWLGATDTFALCEELVAATGIMLVPSRLFMAGDRHVRIGFGRADFPEVLGRFADYLHAQVG